MDPAHLKLTEDIVSGDYWQVQFSNQLNGRIHNLLFNAAGQQLLDGEPSQFPTRTDKKPYVSLSYLEWPLARIGLASGKHFFLNVIRRSGLSEDQPMWSPNFGQFQDPKGLRTDSGLRRHNPCPMPHRSGVPATGSAGIGVTMEVG